MPNVWTIGKPFALVILFLVGSRSWSEQPHPPALMPGLGQHHHAITTKSPEAQRFFDQGLTLVFAFNHEEAVRSFRHAAELDPQAPMPYWGIALALGPCINLDVDPPHEKAAYEAIQSDLAPGGRNRERTRLHSGSGEALFK